MARLGLVGCGRIGRTHAARLARHSELVFCSQSGDSARRLQRRLGGAVSGDLQELLQLPDVAAVVIATPPEAHARQVVACLQAGRSVLVEKPLCLSMDEVTSIERAAAAAPDCFVMVAENYYYKPSLRVMKDWIAGGALGSVRRLQVRKLTRQQDEGWKSGYGALLEGGIHFVALISDLVDGAMGSDAQALLRAPTTVDAEFPSAAGGDAADSDAVGTTALAERHSVTWMRYGEVAAKLHYAWDVPARLGGLFQHSRIEGDGGRILFESNGLYLHCDGKGTGSGRRVRGPDLGDLMGYGAMTRDFLACVAEPGRRPYSDLARARRDLAIVLAAYDQDGAPATVAGRAPKTQERPS